jgi:heat shock protein HtpX
VADPRLVPHQLREKETPIVLYNNVKTAVLLGGLGGLVVLAGSLIGGPSGTVIGLLFGLVIVGSSYWFSDKLAVRSAHAVPVQPGQIPWLEQALATMSARGGIPTPRLYISPNMQPNAFATGRNPRHAVVCVTEGLLQALSADEVAGVVAHELGHVKHRDILISSVAAAIATAISALANMAMFAGMFGGGDDEDRPNPLALLLLMIVGPMAAGVLQMALSRSREYEADRAGAQLLGDPEPLARALEKIEAYARRVPMNISPSQSSAWIVNPLTGRHVSMQALFTTHPPTADRVARLRAMRPASL